MLSECFIKSSLRQGDQMSLWQKRPKCGPTHFLSKWVQNINLGKSRPKMWATSVIQKLHRVKNYPMVENLSNLVTLSLPSRSEAGRPTCPSKVSSNHVFVITSFCSNHVLS
jgi:hypothetical protein